MNTELKFDDVLNLINELSNAKYVTVDTDLVDLDIDPKEVIDDSIRANLFSLNLENNNFDIIITDDEPKIVLSIPLADLPISIDDIITIEDLAVDLCSIGDDVEDLNGLNQYDLIADAVANEDRFYTLQNSWEYTQIKASEFISTLKERYGIQIEKALINKFNGTVEELCESLTNRINRAIQFQNTKV